MLCSVAKRDDSAGRALCYASPEPAARLCSFHILLENGPTACRRALTIILARSGRSNSEDKTGTAQIKKGDLRRVMKSGWDHQACDFLIIILITRDDGFYKAPLEVSVSLQRCRVGVICAERNDSSARTVFPYEPCVCGTDDKQTILSARVSSDQVGNPRQDRFLINARHYPCIVHSLLRAKQASRPKRCWRLQSRLYSGRFAPDHLVKRIVFDVMTSIPKGTHKVLIVIVSDGGVIRIAPRPRPRRPRLRSTLATASQSPGRSHDDAPRGRAADSNTAVTYCREPSEHLVFRLLSAPSRGKVFMATDIAH